MAIYTLTLATTGAHATLVHLAFDKFGAARKAGLAALASPDVQCASVAADFEGETLELWEDSKARRAVALRAPGGGDVYQRAYDTPVTYAFAVADLASIAGIDARDAAWIYSASNESALGVMVQTRLEYDAAHGEG